MKRIFLAILMAFGSVLGQQAWNYNGLVDTAKIVTFKADTLRYSRVFPLSQYENLRIDVMVNDTDNAGFKGDSVKFIWGLQLGHPLYNGAATPALDTFWSGQLICIDTFSLFDTLKIGPMYTTPVDTTGAYPDRLGRMDTSCVTGFAVQSRNIAPAWDVLFRVWLKGLTGNNVGSFLNGRINVVRRASVRVRTN